MLPVVVVVERPRSYPLLVAFVSVLLVLLVAVVTSGGPEVDMTGGGLMMSEVTFTQ